MEMKRLSNINRGTEYIVNEKHGAEIEQKKRPKRNAKECAQRWSVWNGIVRVRSGVCKFVPKVWPENERER